MRHTASQLSDRFHLLSLPQLFVQAVLLGDVFDDHFERGRVGLGLLAGAATEPHTNLLAGLAPPHHFPAEELHWREASA